MDLTPPLSPEARLALPRLAREAIAAHLSGRAYAPPREPAELRERRGAFVTLHERSGGELRGCIGLIEPRLPLGETVAEAAVSAATRDPRFPPVERDELVELTIEVSVLSPLSPIRPEDAVVGTHGLSLRCAGHRGLLLPQVPGEHGWDREQFLEALCRKAGLPPGAWKRPDAQLTGFTAEVVGEAD
jgi:AmmeMemoRadiSam system protein A